MLTRSKLQLGMPTHVIYIMLSFCIDDEETKMLTLFYQPLIVYYCGQTEKSTLILWVFEATAREHATTADIRLPSYFQ